MFQSSAHGTHRSAAILAALACLLAFVNLGCRPPVMDEEAKADRLWQRRKDCVELATLTAQREGLEVGKPYREDQAFVTALYANHYNAKEDACYLYVRLTAAPGQEMREGHVLYHTFSIGRVPMAYCGMASGSCQLYGAAHQTCEECKVFISKKMEQEL